MTRLVLVNLLLFLIGVLGGLFVAAGPAENVPAQVPASTLVPPTLVPFPASAAGETLPSESAAARIARAGHVRVGILYNAPPYGELNIRGDVSGYDADVVRSMAEAWGVTVEFVQVTRQMDAAVDMLRAGVIDLLAAAVVHRREFDGFLEFSQTYHYGRQSMMVRAADPAVTLADMAGRSIGVVIATPAQVAALDWMQRTGISVTLQTFPTLDRAYAALAAGQIDGVIDTSVRLRQVSELQPDSIHILDEPVQVEPHAMAFVRQDVNMRHLVNRTLQYLTATGRMEQIHQTYFPGSPFNVIVPWQNLGTEAPNPAQYASSLVFPAQYVTPRLQSSRVLRVAGLFGVTADSDAPASERRLDTLNRALIENMASRWGVSVEYIPNSAQNALELVASGQADIAVNVAPDWSWAGRVDFTGPYLLHGERLMVRVNDTIVNFVGLRGGGVVATPANEATAAARAVEFAEQVNARIEILQVRENDLAFTILEEESADAAFGDSLRLIAHVQQFPQLLRLTTADDRQTTTPWYSQSYVALAVPSNDIDFRLLVEYTLQELVRDNTLSQLLQPVMLPEDIPYFEIWPGSDEYLGFSLGS